MGHRDRFARLGLLAAVAACGAVVLAACATPAGRPVFLAADAPPAVNPPANPNDFSPATLTVGGGTIDVRITGRPGVSREALLAWIDTAARAVTRYYGRYP